MGEREPFVHVPYFFSDLFDLSFEFWGDPEGAEETVYRGELESGSFSVWWLADGRLLAALAVNWPEEEGKLAAEWIRARARVPAEPLADAGRPLKAINAEAKGKGDE
jgi:hypothetical protein